MTSVIGPEIQARAGLLVTRMSGPRTRSGASGGREQTGIIRSCPVVPSAGSAS